MWKRVRERERVPVTRLALASIIYIYMKRFCVGNDDHNDFQSLLGPSATYFLKGTICFPNCPYVNRWIKLT